MRTPSLDSAWWTLTAVLALTVGGRHKNGSVAQVSAQENASCPTTVQLAVDGASSLDALYSLLEAEDCGTNSTSFISVEWSGTVEVNRTIIVPSGVNLSVSGEGYYTYYYNGSEAVTTSSSSSSSSSGGGRGLIDLSRRDDGDIETTMASVIRGNGSVRLFSVKPDGILYLSGMTLQKGWGGDERGGGIHADDRATIVGDNCRWEFLAADTGGAIATDPGATLTLKGTNVFTGCYSNGTAGGAIYLSNSTVIAQGHVMFDNCSTNGKGGGLYMTSTSLLTVAEAASIYFSGCTAGLATGNNGGGLCSYDSAIMVGPNAKISFENNTAHGEGDGGGLYAKNSSFTVSEGANLSFVDNYAGDGGGGMFLKGNNTEDYVEKGDMVPCFTLANSSNALFVGNTAGGTSSYGGGAHFATGCDVVIEGEVYFEQNIGVRAGAMYLVESRAVISGAAVFVNNTAERWGGAVMLLDSESGLEFNGTVVAQNNSAGRSGGVIYVENARLVVTAGVGGEATRALWEGNSAGYDGGVIAVDGGEVFQVGGFASSNNAAQRGGVLFATGKSLLSWTAGESWSNSAASGGSLYISDSEINLTDVRLAGDHTPSGAVVFLADADARAVNTSIVAPKYLVGDFALQVDANSFLRAFSCSFENWQGGYHLMASEGQVVMDACDFSQSSNTVLFRALRPATVRNAILGDNNYASLGNNASSLFGFDAYACTTLPEAYSCIDNGEIEEECVDADYGMGVLCAAYTAAATEENVSLGGGDSSVELVVPTSTTASSSSSLSAEDAVYYPQEVTQELTLRYSSGGDVESDSSGSEVAVVMGEDAVLWQLRSSNRAVHEGEPIGNGSFTGVSNDNFSWVAIPASGVLVKGQEVTISFVGTPPPPQDPRRPSAVYNGNVSAAFHVLSRTAEAGTWAVSSTTAFEATFYYCPAGAYWDGEQCVLCVELMSVIVDGDESLECDMPGVTLETLPLATGYWRGDVNRTNVLSCPLAEACEGGRGIVSFSNAVSIATYSEDDRYCKTGYVGPYCAVCAEGFRRLSGYECLECGSARSGAALSALWIAVALTPALVVGLFMYLFGGTSSFSQLRKKIGRTFGLSKPAGVPEWTVEECPETGATQAEGGEQEEGESSKAMARAKKIGARVLRAIPFQQLKILIVVWQILTQFSDLADVPYPSSYKRFLGMLDVFDFDISWPLSAMCLIGGINFYEKLIIVTVSPIIVLGALGLSYVGAMQWHIGADRIAIECRQQAKVRHASTALLVLFLVFSSVSTTVFSTFACNYMEDYGVSMLRADYSISCDDERHLFYQIYAGVMILVYPIGIPVMFAYLLLHRRHKINPFASSTKVRPVSFDVPVRGFPKHWEAAGANAASTDFPIMATSSTVLSDYRDNDEEAKEAAVAGRPGAYVTGQGAPKERISRRDDSQRAREEALQKRAEDLDLQPTKFLWEPYEPRTYYFETVECGRRCLMTGALVFVLPDTAGQMAGACIFAFLSLLAFELIRPHLSYNDAWMYRIGCIVIFFSNFLGLSAKTEVSEEDAESQEFFGVLLICVHATMVAAIIFQIVLTMQEASDSRDSLAVHLQARTRSEESPTRRGGTFSTGNSMSRDSLLGNQSPGRQGVSIRADGGIGGRGPTLTTTYGEQLESFRPLVRREDDRSSHDFNHEGPDAVARVRPTPLMRPLTTSWLARETKAAYRPHGAHAGLLTSVSAEGARPPSSLAVTNESINESSVSASGFTKRPPFASVPGAWGAPPSYREATRGRGGSGVDDHIDDLAHVDFATPLVSNCDPACSIISRNGALTYFCLGSSDRTDLGKRTGNKRGLLQRLKSLGSAEMSATSPAPPSFAGADGDIDTVEQNLGGSMFRSTGRRRLGALTRGASVELTSELSHELAADETRHVLTPHTRALSLGSAPSAPSKTVDTSEDITGSRPSDTSGQSSDQSESSRRISSNNEGDRRSRRRRQQGRYEFSGRKYAKFV